MIDMLLSFLKDEDGGPLIEAAAFIPLLLIAYVGVIELTQFINAKDRVNRLLNQTTDLFITSTTSAEVTEAWNSIVALRTTITRPNDVALAIRYCSASTGTGTLYNLTSPTPTYGQCGVISTSATGMTIPNILCPTSSAGYRPGFTEMLKVRTACRYHPLLNWLNLFPDGIVIDSGEVEVPLPRTS